MGKREFDNQPTEDRDNGQRSLGYVGLSAIAHVALLIAVLLAPSFKEHIKNISGIDSGTSVELGDQTPEQGSTAAEPVAAPAEAQPAAGGEVLLADANEPEATETTPPAAKPEPQVVAKPDAKPVAKISKPVVKVATPKAAPAPAPILEGDVAVKDQPKEVEPQKPITIAEAKEEPPVAKDEKPEPVSEAAAPALEEPKADEVKTEEEKPAIAAAAVETPVAQDEKTVAVDEKPVEKVADVQPEPKAESKSEPSEKRSLFSGLRGSNNGSSSNSAGTSGTSSGTSTSAAAQPAAPANTAPNNGSGAGTSGAGAAAAGSALGAAAASGAPVRDARSLEALPGNPKPVYPLSDKMAGRQGTTVLLGRVRPDGTIGEVAIERSSGSRMMDQSAANTFKSWKYKPGQEGLVRLPVQFQLVGDAKVLPTHLRRQ